MSRVRRSALTFGSGLGYSAVTLVVGLIAVPLLIRWLGAEAYGAYRATSDWLAHLMLLEFGLAGALQPLLARSLTEDTDATSRVLAAGIRAYLGVTGIMMVAGAVLIATIGTLVPVGEALRGNLRAGVTVGVAGLLLVPFSPIRTLAEARQRGYRVNAVLLVQSLVTTGLALWLAWRGFGIAGQFVAVTAGLLLFVVLLAPGELRPFRRAFHYLRRPAVIAESRRALRQLNLPTFLRQLSGRLSFLSDRIIVAWLLGPVVVVPLYITQRLAEIVQVQLHGVATATWAALADLHAREHFDVFNRRLVELSRLVTVLAVAALVPIVAFNRTFVTLWVGLDRFGGPAVTLFAAINAYLMALYVLWGWTFGGTGQVARLVPMSIAVTVVNVVASIAGTMVFGMVGPLVGTTIGFVSVASWQLPRLLRRTFQTPVGSLLGGIAVPLALGVPYGLAAWRLARVVEPSWFLLAAAMGASALVYLGAAWFLVFSKDERVVYRGLLQRGRDGS